MTNIALRGTVELTDVDVFGGTRQDAIDRCEFKIACLRKRMLADIISRLAYIDDDAQAKEMAEQVVYGGSRQLALLYETARKLRAIPHCKAAVDAAALLDELAGLGV